MNEYPITSVIGAGILLELPELYEKIHEFRIIAQTEGVELDKLRDEIESVLNQYFVETSTWRLSNWEREFGILSQAEQPDEQRRSVIRSRIRGTGTVTVNMIKIVAESYVNGEVEVSEDNANYTVTITFVSTLGVPPNLADIQAAIRDILPAHLMVNFVFKFYTYAMLIASGKTYTQLKATGLTYDQLYNGGLT